MLRKNRYLIIGIPITRKIVTLVRYFYILRKNYLFTDHLLQNRQLQENNRLFDYNRKTGSLDFHR